jgi:hypothetical protein
LPISSPASPPPSRSGPLRIGLPPLQQRPPATSNPPRWHPPARLPPKSRNCPKTPGGAGSAEFVSVTWGHGTRRPWGTDTPAGTVEAVSVPRGRPAVVVRNQVLRSAAWRPPAGTDLPDGAPAAPGPRHRQGSPLRIPRAERATPGEFLISVSAAGARPGPCRIPRAAEKTGARRPRGKAPNPLPDQRVSADPPHLGAPSEPPTRCCATRSLPRPSRGFSAGLL